MRSLGSVSFTTVNIDGVWASLGAAQTVAVDAFVWAEVEFSTAGLAAIYFRHKRGSTVAAVPHSEWAPAATGSAAQIFCFPVGPVAAATDVQVQAYSNSTSVSGTVKLWAIDPMNALNVAMPASKAADSPLEEIHLSKAALVNMRKHDIGTAEDEILDDDDATTLVTLVPTVAGGVLTLTPDWPT